MGKTRGFRTERKAESGKSVEWKRRMKVEERRGERKKEGRNQESQVKQNC